MPINKKSMLGTTDKRPQWLDGDNQSAPPPVPASEIQPCGKSAIPQLPPPPAQIKPHRNVTLAYVLSTNVLECMH